MDFYKALVSHGVVAALVGALRALDKVTNADVASAVEGCFVLLNWTPHICDRHHAMTESLEAGLIQAIISCADHCNPTPQALDCVRRYLAVFIPESLIYHSIPSNITNSLAAVEDFVHTERFLESGIYDEWRALRTLVEDRLRVLTWFNTEDYESYRACDNIEVGSNSREVNLVR
jgi:hypothetical protein